MAVVYDAAGTVAADGGVLVASLTPGLPAGLAAGKRMVLVIACRAAQTVTVSAGWTKRTLPVETTGTANADVRIEVHDREWQSGDAAPTATFSANSRGCAFVLAVDDDASTTTPLFDTSNSQSNLATATWTAPAVTPAVDNSLLLCLYGADDDKAMSGFTPPTGMTFVIEGGAIREASAYRQGLGAGTGGVSTGSKTVTTSATPSAVGALVVYKPGASAPTARSTARRFHMPAVHHAAHW